MRAISLLGVTPAVRRPVVGAEEEALGGTRKEGFAKASPEHRSGARRSSHQAVLRSYLRAVVTKFQNRYQGFESLPLRQRVSGLRDSPLKCANCARVVAMRTAHRHRRTLKTVTAARHFDFLSVAKLFGADASALRTQCRGQEPPKSRASERLNLP